MAIIFTDSFDSYAASSDLTKSGNRSFNSVGMVASAPGALGGGGPSNNTAKVFANSGNVT